jgi:two-component system response regulator AtoC
MDTNKAARVLVVDDRPEMAEMIAEDLSGHGYDVIAVSSGRDALRMLRTERVDALVTDVRMPDVDGLTLLRASLHLDPSRPVIMMTAYGTLDTAMKANGDGAYQYLIKPFRLEELVQALQRSLRSHASQT